MKKGSNTFIISDYDANLITNYYFLTWQEIKFANHNPKVKMNE